VGCSGATALGDHIGVLRQNQMIEYAWLFDGVERAVINAFSSSFGFYDATLCLQGTFSLSRFAYARRDAGLMVLESPEAHCRVNFLCAETWRWVELFARGIRPLNILSCGDRHGLEFANLLWRIGFLERTDVEEPNSRASWEFHDLLFHWKSRGGRSCGPQWSTYRFLAQWDAPPAVKAAMSDQAIALPTPVGGERDITLIEAIEKRRSNREQGGVPVRLEEIAKLLFHTARVQQRLPSNDQELLLRAVPAAGAVHEIEFYVAVRDCLGLETGLYHYHPEAHALYRLPAPETGVCALLDDAATSWGKPEDPPQVLIVLASRLPRLAWKYEGIAYRLSLLNAGVILQSLYLLATAMHLACSAIGGGDSEVFAAVTGLDAYEETSIAEFAIGSLAEND
jgi:SagB-type dehydrogenase family enzyme